MSNITANTLAEHTHAQPKATELRLRAAGLCLIALAFVLMFFRWIDKQLNPGWFADGTSFLWEDISRTGMSAAAFEDWGHAYIVPIVSIAYIWVRRTTLRFDLAHVFAPGGVLIALGIGLYGYFSVLESNHMFQGVGMLMTLAGIALTLFGPHLFRQLAFPLGYLLLGVTISEAVMLQITWPLRILAAQGGYIALTLMTIDVELAGNVLRITRSDGTVIPLDVAEACSGMRMVVSFIALSFAVAAFSCKQWWHRFAIVLLAVPVALFMNIIRVAVLGLVSLVDQDLAVGEAHTLIGTLLLIPAFLLLMGCVWALKKITPDPTEPADQAQPNQSSRVWLPPVGMSLLIGCVLAGSAAAFTSYVQVSGYRLTKKPVYPLSGQKLNGLPRAFPSFDPVWTQSGPDDVPSAEIIDALGSDNFITRNYLRTKDAPGPFEGRRMLAQLHAVYYTGMIDTVPHVPERCFVGGGLVTVPGSTGLVDIPLDKRSLIEEPADQLPEGVGPILTTRASGTPVRVRLPEGIETLRMNVTEFRAGDESIFAGYFFIANGGVVPTAEAVRIQAFSLDANYAYYLKVQFLSSDVDSREELALLAAEFLDEIFGDIMLCTPDWVDVVDGSYNHEAAEAAYIGGD